MIFLPTAIMAMILSASAGPVTVSAEPTMLRGGKGGTRDLKSDLNYDPSYVIPFSNECPRDALGMKVNIIDGCGATAIDPNSWTTGTQNVGNIVSISGETQSWSDVQKTLSSTATVEGSYAGTTVSASATYAQSSDVSTESTSFWIGQTQIVDQKYIQPGKSGLQLTEDAMNKLKANSTAFVQEYGTMYVAAVNYGNSFTGSVNVYSTLTQSAKSYTASISASANDGIFSASGSASLSNAANSSGNTTKVSIKAHINGNDDSCYQYVDQPSAYLLNQTFMKWLGCQSSNPTNNPVTLQMMPYKSITQVADVCSGSSETGCQELMQSDVLTSTTQNSLTDETTELNLLKKSIEHSSNYNSAICQQPFFDGLPSIKQQVVEQSEYMENLTFEQAMTIQSQLQNQGSSDLLKANALQSQYQSLLCNYCLPPATLPEGLTLDVVGPDTADIPGTHLWPLDNPCTNNYVDGDNVVPFASWTCWINSPLRLPSGNPGTSYPFVMLVQLPTGKYTSITASEIINYAATFSTNPAVGNAFIAGPLFQFNSNEPVNTINESIGLVGAKITDIFYQNKADAGVTCPS